MTEFAGIPEETLAYLTDLEANNEREWFQEHKKRYETAFVAPAKALVTALGMRLKDISDDIQYDPRVNGSIFRINRDVRFSKDKTPYKAHMDLMFWQGAGRSREQAAYFFRLTPSSLIVGVGKPGFTKDELSRYREAVDGDAGVALVSIIEALDTGGYRNEGIHYKRVPNGYPKDHPRAELLKYKGLHAWADLETSEALSQPDIVELCFGHYEALSPLQEWLIAHVMES